MMALYSLMGETPIDKFKVDGFEMEDQTSLVILEHNEQLVITRMIQPIQQHE